jgi:hypothetical protein
MSDGTMREYVDALQGEGAWDRMHDQINGMNIDGWAMPPLMVDGKLVHIFPGTDREVTVDQVKNEIRKALSQIANGECESFEDFDDEDTPA